MAEETIKNLEKLIQKYTGCTKSLVDSKITKLTAPGENYLGIVLKVEATLKDHNNQKETFSAVAKCLNFKLMEFSSGTIAQQFKKEKAFYTEIIPALRNFQLKTNVEERSIENLFPSLHAFRNHLNEDSSEEPDDNAVLLFENLIDKGMYF